MIDDTPIEQLADEDESQSPDLGGLAARAVRAASEDIRVACPGVAGAVDLASGTVAARPAISKNGASQEAEVPGAPLMQLRTSLARLHLPLAAGDPLLMLFSDRSTDEWQAGSGEQVVAQDPRSHDPTDALALPLAKGAAPTGRDNDAVLQGGPGLAGEVAITAAGDIELFPTAGKVVKVAGDTDFMILGSTFKTACSGLPIAAVDPATTMALVNAIRVVLQALPLSTKSKVG